MTQNISTSNSRIIISKEAGSGGSYTIQGANNFIHLNGVWAKKIIIMGNNNLIGGTENFETIKSLVVLGHNNTFNFLNISQLDIWGIDNKLNTITYDSLEIANINLIEDTERLNEILEDSTSEQISDSDPRNSELNEVSLNSNYQIGQNTNQRNIDLSYFRDYQLFSSDDSSEDYEEEHSLSSSEGFTFESYLIREVKTLVIGALTSFSYNEINKEESCAICLWNLEIQQQVKKLQWSHIFHSACIDSWLKEKLICPWCKNYVY